MNRIDRISAMLIQLQSKKIVTGQGLADRFGISLRTVYRDMKSLEEAGVPIVSEAGVGYSLMEGYRLPPVMFTKEEATAFLTAEKLVEKLTDRATYKVYESALFKIKAVLRSDEKAHLEHMYQHIEVIDNPYLPKQKSISNYIQVLLHSISQKRVLTLHYFANHSQEFTKRNIEALGIFYNTSTWYLVAFCRTRNDYRTFRIDRIKQVEETSLDFQKEHPPLKHFLKSITLENQALHKVVLVMEKKILKYIAEQKFYNGFVSEKDLGDTLEMTFLTSNLESFARWYLMYGDHAKISSPSSLKTRIKEILTVMKKNLLS